MSLAHPQFLPAPDVASAEHSARMQTHLAARVSSQGGISFAQFMQEVLYAPGLGYYSAGATKFSMAGDFTTAPESGALFGRLLARHFNVVRAALPDASIIEFGAGSGRLALTMLSELHDMNRLPARYIIVEVSADLRERQRELLATRLGDLASCVTWVDDPASLHLEAMIVANEVMDALPVERFRVDEQGAIEQQFVVVGEGGALETEWRGASTELKTHVKQLQQRLGRELPNDYQSEACLMLPGWLRLLAQALERGVVVLSDYGYGRQDFYREERQRGTLTCHFRQHAHHDPLLLPGIQDVTAWVDFSLVAETLRDAGLEYLGFTNQSQFALQGGIAELARDTDDAIDLAREVQMLTMPGQMGERFRLLAFHRHCQVRLPGFTGRDYGYQL